MSKKKIIWLCVVGILTVAAIIDAVRYLKPDAENKIMVQPKGSLSISSCTEMVLVYNAWGGIYPGLVDFVHKEIFPKTYPCNLCYQTFGTFGMKDEWRRYIDSLPLKIIQLHKEEFKRMYSPEDLQLPVILIGDGRDVQVLLSAKEINEYKSVQQIIKATQIKLQALK